MRDFNKDLESSDDIPLIKEVAMNYFHTDKVRKVNWGEHFYGYILEKLGIDYIIIQEYECYNKIITLQLKLVNPRYFMQNVCVEVYHAYQVTDNNNEQNATGIHTRVIEGGIFNTKADYIVYAWRDTSPVLLIDTVKLKHYFDMNKDRYKLIPTSTKGKYNTWVSYNIFVPLEDLEGCYQLVEVKGK